MAGLVTALLPKKTYPKPKDAVYNVGKLVDADLEVPPGCYYGVHFVAETTTINGATYMLVPTSGDFYCFNEGKKVLVHGGTVRLVGRVARRRTANPVS